MIVISGYMRAIVFHSVCARPDRFGFTFIFVICKGDVMDLPQIEAFVEISKCRSFSKAARKLHINQSSISMRIRRLEQELGVELFTRAGNSIQLSPQGERFLPYAKQCLESLALGVESLTKGTDSPDRFRISASNPFQELILPHLLTALMMALPDLTFDIIPFRNKILNVNLHRDIDICVVNGRELSLKPDGMEIVPFYEDDCVLLANPSHPLAQNGPIAPKQLSDAKLMLINPQNAVSLEMMHFLKSHGVVPASVSHIGNVASTLEMAKKSDMLAVLPRLLAYSELASGELAEIAVEPKPEPVVTYLVYGIERARNYPNFFEQFKTFTIQLMKELKLPCRPFA